MPHYVTIPELYEEILEYKDVKASADTIDDIIKKMRQYISSINNYFSSGFEEDEEIALEALEMASNIEKRLTDAKLDSYGTPEINPEEIKYDPTKDMLGEGVFGAVYKCQCRGKTWAVKVPKVGPMEDNLEEWEQWMDEFKKEIRVMKKVYHPNVVLFLGASIKPIMIVTEYMPCGDLDGFIHNENYSKVTIEKKLNIALGVASGMNWIHGICHIIHRDLKPSNILMDSTGTPKITDFGLSNILSSENEIVHDICGSPRYEAPEILNNKPLEKSVDVYAFGLILYELMTGRLPFGTYTDKNVLRRDVNRGIRPIVVSSDNIPPAIVDLMSCCWAGNPAERPTFDVVCKILRSALYELKLPHKEPRDFWEDNFIDETDIHFKDICRMAKRAGVELGKINGIESILCDKDKAISMKRFTQLYEWFGPWFKFREARSIIEEVAVLMERDWFHGFIGRDVALSRLHDRKVGTFLVRLSTYEVGQPFTISYMATKDDGSPGINNARIKRVAFCPSVYEFNGKQFKSLDEIIKLCRDAKIITSACPKESKPFSLY